MKSLRFLDRRAGFSLASLGLLLGIVVPSLVPAFASAGTLTTRSVAMSVATHDATANYTVTFTPTATFDNVVIDWCSDTPLAGVSCSTPSGLKVKTGVTLGTTSNLAGSPALTTADETENHTVLAASPTAATSPVSFTLTGVTNPTAVGTFYARIYTYTTANYSNTNTPASLGTTVDGGSVALSTSNDVGVTAYVLESMTFCVSKAQPTKGCVGTTAPNVTLGETSGSVIALDSAHLSTQDIYAQLSTNASGGATVNLKSNASNCGGLFRNGSTSNCDIAPQDVSTNTIAAGQALFGLKLGAAANASDAGATADHTGTLAAANGSHYSSSDYFMDYAGDDTSGVTGPYGSPFIDTAGGVVSNMNIPITLGASVSNQTPAGSYGASLSMIATGKF